MSVVFQGVWSTIMGRTTNRDTARPQARVSRVADAGTQVAMLGQANTPSSAKNKNANIRGTAPRSQLPLVDRDATRSGATNFNKPGEGYTAGGGVQTRTGTLSNDHPSGSFGPDDRIDYWKFTLNQSNGVNIKLSGMTADLDLYLEDASGRVINSSTRSGTVDDSLDALLGPGTYYIRVQRVGATGSNYSLQLTTGQDSRPTAINLGTNPGGTVGSPFNIHQTVGNGDVSDFFRFDVSSRRGVRATLTGLAVDVDLEIQNASGNVIKRASASGRTNEVLRVNLNAGTYYVRVYRFATSGESTYNLQIAATPGVFTDLP